MVLAAKLNIFLVLRNIPLMFYLKFNKYLIFLLLSLFYVLKLSFPQNNLINCLLFSIYVRTTLFIVSNSFWLTYVFFESVLIVILLIIIALGLNPYRISAILWMLIYSLVFSTPRIIIIIVNNKFLRPHIKLNPLFLFSWRVILMYMIFFTKVPVYLLHFWLPKAHVEASTWGSIFLASLLLKLGSLGCLKLLIWTKKFFRSHYFILSGCFVLLLCIFQTDMKKIIALTSVYHISISLALLFTKTSLGLKIFFLINTCHRLISAPFFYMSGLLIQIRNSRIIYLQEINKFNPKKHLLLLLILSNVGVPPFYRFMVEVLSYSVLFQQVTFYIFFIRLGVLLTIFYRLLLLNNIKYWFYKRLKTMFFIKNISILKLVVLIFFL